MIDDELPEALAGERLDRIVAMLGDCSRSQASKVIESGAVSIDGSVCRNRSVPVATGCRITFQLPPARDPDPKPEPAIEIDVVHQDDDIIVINKPAGLVVHPGAGQPDGTLVNGLLAAFPEIAAVGQRGRPGIVHRLDSMTSGLLVVAKSDAAYDALVSDLAAHAVGRRYVAVVHGIVADDRGTIDGPIGRSARRRTRMAVTADGKPAVTHYEVMKRHHESPPTTLLSCNLETGRTHQIRVHLTAIGHPVVGDSVYGSARDGLRLDRVALHAVELDFVHPATDERVRFAVDPPPSMQGLLHSLEMSEAAAPAGS